VVEELMAGHGQIVCWDSGESGVVDAVEPPVLVSAETASWKRRKASEPRFLLAEAVFDVGESEVDGLHHSWELLATADA
jgi:hypothetical protein